MKQAAGTPGESSADQLHKLADLKSQGVLTDAEFEAQKAKILASWAPRVGKGKGAKEIGFR